MAKELCIGYQLYSARAQAEKDLEGVLRQVKDMGYQGVEFAGFYGRTAKEVRKLLKTVGIKAVSSHVPLQLIEDDMRSVITYHKKLGCKYIAIPYLHEDCRPGASGFAAVLRLIYQFGRMCKKNGITLLYHNHDFEFVQVSGQAGLDFLYSAIPVSLLKTEIDTCWVKYVGAEPSAYIRKYAGRCPVIHFKDYEGTGSDKPPYALIGLPETETAADASPFQYKPLGHGCQDIAALWQAALDSKAKWVIVEQDESPERDPMEDARLSMETLQRIRSNT